MSDDIPALVAAQRAFFAAGATRPWAFRDARLRRLKRAIEDNEARLFAALKADLRKPEYEAYGTEVGIALEELSFTLKHLERWMEPRRVPTPLTLQPAASFQYPEPYGVCLIIAPWNYPFGLLVNPLIGALAAGNCAVLKPSELAPRVSETVAAMLGASFEPELVRVVEGGAEESRRLLAERFDKIFFTGGTEIGRLVAKAAAEHLTPVTLELGGKSPCIVDADADLALAAKRIAWGKFLNAGQTCVAPDYLLVQRGAKERLVAELKARVNAFYGEDPARSPDYPRIVNERHFDRLAGLLRGQRVLFGGQVDRADRYIAPTVLDAPGEDAPVMREEIFGPILPVLEFERLEEALAAVNRRPKPLALYYFGSSPAAQERVLESTSAGGACVNDVIVHLASPYLPFGGVGPSGNGAYHGEASFEAFTHRKSVLKKSTLIDDPFRYAPYAGKLRFLRWLFN